MARPLIDPGVRAIQEIAVALAEITNFGELRFGKPPRMLINFNEGSHRYKLDDEHVPSVTTILDDTEVKHGLTWWGFRVGLAFAIRAIQSGELSPAALMSWEWEPVIKPGDFYATGHPDISCAKTVRGVGKPKHAIEHIAMEIRHHPNAIRDDRGTVGASIHHGAEILAMTGSVPALADYPEADRGYVQALARYWLDADCEVEGQEMIVASKRFQYAGRFDKIVRLNDGQRRMRDYKTSSGVYSSHDKQLALYDVAYLEMGGEPLDGHDIVHLRPDGTYAVVPAVVDHLDAILSLAKYHADQRLGVRLKALGRQL